MLADFNLDIAIMVQMVGALYAYVSGVVSYELAEIQNVRQTGLSIEDKRELATPYIEQLIAEGQHPNFVSFFRADVTLDPE